MPRIATEKQKCLSRVAYDRIKVMILQKELMPGQFINESQLQETLELGRTPVREAVLALAQDRLVTIHPRKGIEVTRPTPNPRYLRDSWDHGACHSAPVLRHGGSTVGCGYAGAAAGPCR